MPPCEVPRVCLVFAARPLRELIRLVGDAKIPHVRKAPPGFEVVATITLEDGSKIVQAGALKFEGESDIGSADGGGVLVSLSITGANRRVSLISSGNVDFWADDANPYLELPASCKDAFNLKLTMIRERDGKILRLYDGRIPLCRRGEVYFGGRWEYWRDE